MLNSSCRRLNDRLRQQDRPSRMERGSDWKVCRGTAVTYMYFRRYSYSRKHRKSGTIVKPLPVDLPNLQALNLIWMVPRHDGTLPRHCDQMGQILDGTTL